MVDVWVMQSLRWRYATAPGAERNLYLLGLPPNGWQSVAGAEHAPSVPTYDYLCDHPDCPQRGILVERFLRISQAAEVMTCPHCGHHTWRKCVGGGEIASARLKRERQGYPYVSNRLPLGLAGCDHSGPLRKPIIRSVAHEREVMAGLGTGTKWTRD